MTLTLAAIGLVAAIVYALSCWIYPFRRCPRCHGTGRQARGDGRVFRLCRRCHGTGRRLRIGRRMWNAYRHLYRLSR